MACENALAVEFPHVCPEPVLTNGIRFASEHYGSKTEPAIFLRAPLASTRRNPGAWQSASVKKRYGV